MAALRYIEVDPVSSRIVKEAADYPWSSACCHLAKLGVCKSGRFGEEQSIGTRRRLDSTEYLQANDETTLLRGICTGRPAGSELIEKFDWSRFDDTKIGLST